MATLGDPSYNAKDEFKKLSPAQKLSPGKKLDVHTINLLNKVSNQINTQNQQIFDMNGGISAPSQFNLSFTIPLDPTEVSQEPNPNIDMEKDIYKHEFEEYGTAEVGNRYPAKDFTGLYTIASPKNVSIGIIDSVSEDEEDLYAKFPDGEIIPFNGHIEKFSVQISSWNDIKRSNLIGNEIQKAATCQIYINDRLARIIEGVEVQDLLMKADRAIDELKVQPFSICRDAGNLIGREVYYNNQPAIIDDIDDLNNFIHIIPDIKYLNNFTPPAYAIEDDEAEEWINNFGYGMLIRDYDEKIWWWRNTSGGVNDPSTDPFYKQFPQPVKTPAPPLTPIPPGTQIGTQIGYYPGVIPNIQYPMPNPNVINPWYYNGTPYTVNPNTVNPTSPYSASSIYAVTDHTDGSKEISWNDVDTGTTNVTTLTVKEQIESPQYITDAQIIRDIQKEYYSTGYKQAYDSKVTDSLNNDIDTFAKSIAKSMKDPNIKPKKTASKVQQSRQKSRNSVTSTKKKAESI